MCVSGGVDRYDFEFELRHVQYTAVCFGLCALPRAMTETIRNADTKLPHAERLANMAIYSVDNVGPADYMITAHQSVTTMQGLM